jgi:hypothetical protein
MTDDDEAAAWLTRTRRHNALRVLAIGLVVLIPTVAWLFAYHDYEGSDNSRVRFVGLGAGSIGTILTIAGGVMYARARR